MGEREGERETTLSTKRILRYEKSNSNNEKNRVNDVEKRKRANSLLRYYKIEINKKKTETTNKKNNKNKNQIRKQTRSDIAHLFTLYLRLCCCCCCCNAQVVVRCVFLSFSAPPLFSLSCWIRILLFFIYLTHVAWSFNMCFTIIFDVRRMIAL